MLLYNELKTRNWTAIFGYFFFIGMMATGYYYNVTFIQLGLVDLGTRLVGMSRGEVAGNMAFLAALTCAVALGFGTLMKRRGWSQDFLVKLRLAFGVVLVQTLLTAAAPAIRSQATYLAWIAAASIALGVGVPATFSLTVDLVPRRSRGYAAALITSAAYFAAEMFSTQWTIEAFSAQFLALMLAGTLGLGLLAFAKLPWVKALAQQHNRPEFKYGRYVHRDKTGRTWVSRKLFGLITLMFGIFFVDSLGFLRMVETPAFMQSAWQSPELSIRLLIAGAHIAAALIAGILYTALGERRLFFWIFGIFALVHMMYTLELRFSLSATPSLANPVLYATAVSLYTVVNFALWADISTPETISLNTALGVALSGWTATFISTAVAIHWMGSGMSLEQHLRIVDSLAMLFFVAMLLLSFFPSRRTGTARSAG